MPRNISWRKFVQNFQRLDFEGPHSGGKHLFMKKGPLKIHIPYKHKGEISSGLINEILRQAGVNKKDWNKL